jgi:sensor histidine kinase YesM
VKGRYTQTAVEILAWTGFLVFPVVLFPTFRPFYSEGQLNPVLFAILLTHSLLIGFYYLNMKFAIPRLYFRGNYRGYMMFLGSCVTFIVLLMQLKAEFSPFYAIGAPFGRLIFILSILLRFVFVTLVSLGISNFKRLRQTEKEKLATELAYLRAQVNPHFLFNTLNSIYALSAIKSDKAPLAVTRLSSIMRYAISDANADFVPLNKELENIASYIELEKLRMTPNMHIEYSVAGDTAGKLIAPLTLNPLIENAFKHGVSTREPATIRISISIRGNSLSMDVHNPQWPSVKREGNGIGLTNLRKRLDMLYPGRHKLSVSSEPDNYLARLQLDLS